MSKYDFVSLVESRKRQLLVDLLRRNTELTLGELNQLARGEIGKLLRSITVDELLHAEGVPGAARTRTSRPGREPRERAARAGLNTRSATGREAFDRAVLEALEAIGGPANAGDVQRRVGGTNVQVRSSLNRLIETGWVTWSGRARGTRYHLA